MGYYTGFRGDYYRGDYYRGDPGLFSFIGKALGGVAKVAGGALGGFLTGGPLGAVRGGLTAITGGGGFSGIAPPPPMLALPSGGPRQYGLININRPAPVFDGGGGGVIAQPGMRVRGHHPNKSTYVTRGGGTSRWPQSLMVHPKGTELVTSRRMNVGNARALRRSLRRIAGFAKLVKRSKRAISRAASAVGVHRGVRGRHAARAPSVRIVKAA
jgi:hypothetical protein